MAHVNTVTRSGAEVTREAGPLVSEYGYLLCVDDRTHIWLGKAVKTDDDRIGYFAMGDKEPNWRVTGPTLRRVPERLA